MDESSAEKQNTELRPVPANLHWPFYPPRETGRNRRSVLVKKTTSPIGNVENMSPIYPTV